MGEDIWMPIQSVWPRVDMTVRSFKGTIGNIEKVDYSSVDPIVTIKWRGDSVIDESVFPLSRLLMVKAKITPGDCDKNGYIFLTNMSWLAIGKVFVTVNQAQIAEKFGWVNEGIPHTLCDADREPYITMISKQ